MSFIIYIIHAVQYWDSMMKENWFFRLFVKIMSLFLGYAAATDIWNNPSSGALVVADVWFVGLALVAMVNQDYSTSWMYGVYVSFKWCYMVGKYVLGWYAVLLAWYGAWFAYVGASHWANFRDSQPVDQSVVILGVIAAQLVVGVIGLSVMEEKERYKKWLHVEDKDEPPRDDITYI